MRHRHPAAIATAVAAVLLVTISACSSKTKTPTPAASASASETASAATTSSPVAVASSGAPSAVASGSAEPTKSYKIGLLLPESQTTRYEAFDHPLFVADLKLACPSCQFLYGNADQDSSKQQQQADAMLTNGVNVLVLDPVDGAAAGAIVKDANAQHVPVLDDERLIPNANVAYYVSYDNLTVGKLQATALVTQMKAIGKPTGTIVMIDGSPTDNNATLFKQGAHSVLDGSGLKIGAEFATPDWTPANAQQEMEQAITRLGKNNIAGVYAANDGTAGGAVAAMKQAGMNPLPPITGQDAQIDAIQRILAGEQFMTIYKAIAPESKYLVEVAVALAQGNSIPADAVNQQTNNTLQNVPSEIFPPVVVTKANVKSTVFADHFVTYAQVCTATYASACAAAGITN